MLMSQKYLIVHFIDNSKVPNEFPSSEWPLHVTLLANFTLGAPIEQLDSELKNFALQEKPYDIMADGDALFGPKQSVGVSLIQPNQNIQRMHETLSAIASRLGAVFDEPAFMGEGYRPHATIQVNSRLLDKQLVTLNDFTLVDMFPGNNINRRRLIETYKLGGK
jgi:2'-5' RNA ligase